MNQLFVVTVPGGSVTEDKNKENLLTHKIIEQGRIGKILKWDGEEYRWVNPKNTLTDSENECGSSSNVRWLTEDQVTAYDSEGDMCICKCGRKAITTLFFWHSQIHYCNNCYLELTNEK